MLSLMLIRFEVSNHRSIAEPAELSMVAIDEDRPEARAQESLGASLLTVAALYGPNASGKSNVLSAYSWLCDAVRHSLRRWDEEIPVEPFAFDGNTEPTAFEVEHLVGGVRYEYLLEITRERVVYEALFHYPENRRRRIFEREGGTLKLQRGMGHLSGIRELLTDRTLALSVARRHDDPLIVGFVRALLRVRSRVLGERQSIWERLRGGSPFSLDLFERDDSRALAMLRLADLGIENVQIEEESGPRGRFMGVRLVHRTETGLVPLEFAAESEGTRSWFRLIGPVLSVLEAGAVMLFDELDASLHPTLSAQLIKLFHDPATNPLGAQLIFASHDTSLLNHLNRDEVWLTEKSKSGVTRLGPLAEFAGERVRKSQNLESGYLHGRFGALPDIDQTELLRVLGLIG
ncbi:hypothetical protein LV78_006022 [Actinosynnema pretiosum]|nr:hypothetical protein [Actinosynnema pretiosum]